MGLGLRAAHRVGKLESVEKLINALLAFQGICWPEEKQTNASLIVWEWRVVANANALCLLLDAHSHPADAQSVSSFSNHRFDYSNQHVMLTETNRINLRCKYESSGGENNVRYSLCWHNDTQCCLLIRHKCFFPCFQNSNNSTVLGLDSYKMF